MTQPSGRAGRVHATVDRLDRWIDDTFEFPVIYKAVSLTVVIVIAVAAIQAWLRKALKDRKQQQS